MLDTSQKQLASERIAALLEDRKIREGEEEAHRAAMNQQLEVLAQKLKKTEETLRTTTKDYILGALTHKGLGAESGVHMLASSGTRGKHHIFIIHGTTSQV